MRRTWTFLEFSFKINADLFSDAPLAGGVVPLFSSFPFPVPWAFLAWRSRRWQMHILPAALPSDLTSFCTRPSICPSPTLYFLQTKFLLLELILLFALYPHLSFCHLCHIFPFNQDDYVFTHLGLSVFVWLAASRITQKLIYKFLWSLACS